MKIEFIIYKEKQTRRNNPVWIVESIDTEGNAIDRSEHTSRLKAFNNLWRRCPGCGVFYMNVGVKGK